MTRNVAAEVVLDIQETRKLRAITAVKAEKMIAYVQANPAEIDGYRAGGMRIAAITDLVRNLV